MLGLNGAFQNIFLGRLMLNIYFAEDSSIKLIKLHVTNAVAGFVSKLKYKSVNVSRL